MLKFKKTLIFLKDFSHSGTPVAVYHILSLLPGSRCKIKVFFFSEYNEFKEFDVSKSSVESKAAQRATVLPRTLIYLQF